MRIERAAPEDAALLKEIAVTSKGYWGYDRHWLETWRQKLRLDAETVRRHHTYVARVDDRIIGWYLMFRRDDAFVLDHLWVVPEFIGQGVGRALFEHALSLAQTEGGTFLELEAEPNARGFYERMGARYLRDNISEMGRPIPVMRMELGG